jgi:hypothetical protein
MLAIRGFALFPQLQKPVSTEQDCVAVALDTCIQEVSGVNLGWVTLRLRIFVLFLRWDSSTQ